LKPRFQQRNFGREFRKNSVAGNWQPPLVVKPVRQGSSVGLQFVERVEDWQNALAEALKFDSEVLVERKIAGRETTVGHFGPANRCRL